MRKIFVRFFTIADYEEEETWLRKQHRAGWRLVRTVLPCFFIFEACEPEDVVYRLDYRNCRWNGEYMQMLADFGWEYFNSCMGWLYFRKPAAEMNSEGESELLSDDAGKLEMITHIFRTRMLPILIVFLTCVLPNLFRAATGNFGPGSFGFFVAFVVLLIVNLWLLFHCGAKLWRLRQKYTRD